MDKQTREKKEKKGKRPNGEDSVDTSTDRIKQLEDEWYWAKLEDAFLKELRRLRLEEEHHTQPPRTIQTERPSQIYRYAKNHFYVLAEKIQ